MNLTFPKRQQGVALAVSLIFLVLITIIGVASLRGTTMNEMMAANSQQKSTAFQAAESTIAGVWNHDYVLGKTPTALVNPAAVTTTTDKDNIAFNTRLNNTAVASASIQYCGEALPGGTELNAATDTPGDVAHVYSIHGIAAIAAANTTSNHDQRGSILRPSVGRTGNCP